MSAESSSHATPIVALSVGYLSLSQPSEIISSFLNEASRREEKTKSELDGLKLSYLAEKSSESDLRLSHQVSLKRDTEMSGRDGLH